jgi:hypothetical protein
VVLSGIVIELVPREPIFEKCPHLREKGGVLTEIWSIRNRLSRTVRIRTSTRRMPDTNFTWGQCRNGKKRYLNLRFFNGTYISKFSLLRRLRPLNSLRWAPRQMVLVNEIAENERAMWGNGEN